MTLRSRAFLYVAAAALASCALTVGVAIVLVRHRISSHRIAALERQADVLAAAGGAPGALGPGIHVYAVGSGRPRLLGPRRAAAVAAAIPPAGDAQGTATVGDRTLIYAARSTPAGRIVLVRPAAFAFGEWRPFLLSLLLAGLGGALLAGACAYLLARRLTRPVAELSRATARIAAGDPEVEVRVEGEDELARLAGAFNRMAGELARARDAQRRFLESVSHELKTPLTSIRGYSEAIAEGAVSGADGARVISLEADRLERLVQDLLDLARLGREDFSVAREPVDLAAVAGQAVERHLPAAQELSVELACISHGPACGLGDHDRLLQAVSNLIENALRLTPAGGRVTVEAAPGRLTVRDTGPGIAPEDLAHAFERFYLYERYRSERPVGSGLGLTIVGALAEAMGGRATAASAPGGGTEFTLSLRPGSLIQQAAPEQGQAAPGAAIEHGHLRALLERDRG